MLLKKDFRSFKIDSGAICKVRSLLELYFRVVIKLLEGILHKEQLDWTLMWLCICESHMGHVAMLHNFLCYNTSNSNFPIVKQTMAMHNIHAVVYHVLYGQANSGLHIQYYFVHKYVLNEPTWLSYIVLHGNSPHVSSALWKVISFNTSPKVTTRHLCIDGHS